MRIDPYYIPLVSSAPSRRWAGTVCANTGSPGQGIHSFPLVTGQAPGRGVLGGAPAEGGQG